MCAASLLTSSCEQINRQLLVVSCKLSAASGHLPVGICQCSGLLTRLLMNSDMKIGTMVMMSTRLCQEKMYLQQDMVAECGRL
jgi:hypothetical protein